MKIIPIRIKIVKKANHTAKFNFLYGLKNICRNISYLFTRKILSGGSAWIIDTSEETILRDVSLVWDKNDMPAFVNTPEGAKKVLMEITQIEKYENNN